MFYDSPSAIHLAKNQVYHARTKYINIWFQFVQKIINVGKILLWKGKTVKNLTNMLTKVVVAIKFKYYLNMINNLQA